MKRATSVGVVSTFGVVVIAGCAVGTAAFPPGIETRPPGLSGNAAQHLAEELTKGERSKAEVKARLGDATVVRLTSGHEVWVYRITEGGDAKQRARRGGHEETERNARGELVILFAPSGKVTRARTRLPPTTD